jgi:hypothetical protein
VVLVAVSVVGCVLALVFQWPSDFVLGEQADAKVTAADVVSGTVTSIPLPPFLVLVVCAVLARSRGRRGAVATALLAPLGLLFAVGGLGELTSKNPNVPRGVLVGAGLVYALLGIALSATAALAVVAERRAAALRPAGGGRSAG